MYNKAILLGRLTADPELKTTQNGTAVTSFSVACDRSYQEKGQDRKCDFIPCVAWRQTAEFITRYFKKGSPILIEGEIQVRSYDKNGETRYITEVIVDRVSFTGSKGGSDSPSDIKEKPAREAANGAGTAAAAAVTAADEEYPF